MSIEKLKYPIGIFDTSEEISEEHLTSWKQTIENFPKAITSLAKNLSVEELNYPYRPEGWNIKQVVHHCADSHMNAITRFKLALTEDMPIIKPYNEAAWAQLSDGNDNNLSASLDILSGLHKRWTQILHDLSKDDLNRIYVHPEHGKKFNLKETIGMYAWHCNHHQAHISQALHYKGKFK